jgi:hypothetical protein
MPTKAQKLFTAASLSRVEDWESCPFFARCKHLDKLPVPVGPAMDRGRRIHKLAEDYGTGRLKELPPELKLFKKEFTDLRRHAKHLAVEQQVAVDDRWVPTDWFGADAWLRIVFDAVYDVVTKLTVRVIIDHKTGKVYREKNQAQLDLYAAVGFALPAQPAVVEVKTKLWYLDQGEEVVQTFKPGDVPKLRAAWERRVKPFYADRTFKPTPSERACHPYGKPCPFSRSVGGPCRF